MSHARMNASPSLNLTLLLLVISPVDTFTGEGCAPLHIWKMAANKMFRGIKLLQERRECALNLGFPGDRGACFLRGWVGNRKLLALRSGSNAVSQPVMAVTADSD